MPRSALSVSTAPRWILTETPEGLYGVWRIHNTPEGLSAYENAREGTYGGLSIGFVARREQQVNGIREILTADLDHVSLVDEPAYAGAQVISIRSA